MAALEALCHLLGDAGYDPRLDREMLAVGDAWRTDISQEMHDCDGAIVLVSQAALRSEHVLGETYVLMDRRAHAVRLHDDPPFVLFPVLVGVTSTELANSGLNTPAITELQLLEWSPAAGAEILRRLRPLLDEAQARDGPDYTLELRLIQQMKISLLMEDTIEQALESMGSGMRTRSGDGHKALARALIRGPHEDQLRALSVLHKIHSSELALMMYRHVAPHGLVPRDAAAVVRKRAQAPQRERGAGINCTKTAVCELYVRRANFAWRTIAVAATWSDREDDILEEVRDALAHALHADPDEDLNELLADEPRFLLLPHPLPTSSLVDRLRAEFGNLVLVFRCKSREDLGRWQVAGAEYVLPELPEGREEALLRSHRKAQRLLERADDY